MSPLQEKSDILREAAGLLHQEGLYPAVAHSAYYRCLQLSKHIWLNVLCKTEEELDSKGGTHVALINSTREHIRRSNKNKCREDARSFNRDMWLLKKLRERADYGNIIFSQASSEESIDLSDKLQPILKKYL